MDVLSHILRASARLSVVVYRIVQETLTNIAKYAAATDVSIEITHEAATKQHQGKIKIEISDNGIGFDLRRKTTGFGLEGVNYRATAVGGAMQIESGVGFGTKVSVQIPLK